LRGLSFETQLKWVQFWRFTVNLGMPHNKSLDASGTTGLAIDNLSVTWLTAAASTQPFDAFL
jgi:hypothetical protein